MGNGILSRIMWSETLVFMLIRIACGSIAVFLVILVTGGASQSSHGSQSELLLGSIVAIPVMVLMLSGVSLITAWLSQVGLPFAGLVSMICSFPMYLGDPLVWMLHKVRPEWVPVEEPAFFNPPIVWVLSE